MNTPHENNPLGNGTHDWSRIVLRWEVAGERPGVIEWTVTESSASAHFVSASGADSLDMVAPVSVTRDGDLLHIDCGPALGATVRLGPGRARVLYARTSMLARVGVVGGRSRVAGCEVDRHDLVAAGRATSS